MLSCSACHPQLLFWSANRAKAQVHLILLCPQLLMHLGLMTYFLSFKSYHQNPMSWKGSQAALKSLNLGIIWGRSTECQLVWGELCIKVNTLRDTWQVNKRWAPRFLRQLSDTGWTLPFYLTPRDYFWKYFLKDHYQDFPGGSDGKQSAWKARDLGLIPRSGRSPGEGNGNPL